ncbi:UPF0481 protein At3g47200-like [Phoenix dactylifera]|uniref:UPF0481 protein At3g47200-like n=1 Tax=Phoenix dactylifera TaxID=42345 RepID=A0A8B7BKV7_PHODC|nr:UPF0481 protein At3g47200-like [Phoenix dactylifera]
MNGRRPSGEANQHVRLNINTAWLESVQDRARESLHRKPPTGPTIFRVPPTLRRGNELAYEPKLVSIGPYHHDKEDLKAMEGLKWRLLHHYLSKVPNGGKNEGLTKIKDLENRARDCYSEVIDMGSDQFVEMLLLDGCFLVQILNKDLQAEELSSLVHGNWWFDFNIFVDLMLLENQLPYFIVQHLLETLGMPGWDSSRLLNAVIYRFYQFGSLCREDRDPELPAEGFDVDHLLHLFHRWIRGFPRSDVSSTTSDSNGSRTTYSALSLIIDRTRACLSKVLPCRSNSSLSGRSPGALRPITRLAEAGVKIEVKSASSFLDITFCEDQGVLKIPAISVDGTTNSFFANLIALEQCSWRHGMDVTEYTVFMDGIIDTSRDVELLHREGIIQPYTVDDADIASLFNKLSRHAVFSPGRSYLADVCEGLNTYCESRWPRWRAKLVHDYFSNPWTIISLVAAVVLLGLTILQSVYAILDYYKR